MNLHFWLAMKYGRYRTQTDEFGLDGLRADLDRQDAKERRHTRMKTWLAIAAGISAVALPILGLSMRSASNEFAATPGGAPVAAIVAGVRQCEWGDSGTISRLGQIVRVGDSIDLRTGLAELQFDSGATAVIRGPTTLQITSPRSCSLGRGELFVDVKLPSANFTVAAAGAEIEDVGTAFGVRCETDRKLEVQVVEGRVRLYEGPRRQDTTTTYFLGELSAGELGRVTTASWNEPRTLDVVEAPDERFVRSLPDDARRWSRSGDDALAWDGFNHTPPSGLLAGARGGVGWPGTWNVEEVKMAQTDVIGFADWATQRIPGNAAVHRRLPRELAEANDLFASARFRIVGDDPVCTAWILLFEDTDPHVDDEANCAAFGISDGKFSARLAAASATLTVNPNSKRLGDFGGYQYGKVHRLVARLQFDVDGNRDRLSLWIDPPSGETPPTPDHVVDYNTGRRRVDSAAVRFWEMDNQTRGYVDDLRIGRTWRAATE